ncbi:unnamed protein product [Peniophora sp. CBMAI 1063]|nr:unnamed protein product [Peniophora sp. CBMAI 1063]
MGLGADPTYPLYPVLSLLASVLLLLLLFTSLVRQRWNLGVAFLCFWLFLENLVQGVDAIVWADNADIKAYVYCDIVTHLQMICTIVRPMASLIITRRLYLMSSSRVEILTQKLGYRDLAIEWFLGLGIPVIVAGPLYYVSQSARFVVIESVGCINVMVGAALSLLLTASWGIIVPLVTITVYYPRVLRTFYLHYKDANRYTRSESTVSRTSYLRILMLASIDILLTLPTNIVSLALDLYFAHVERSFPFYPGWSVVHSDWSPQSISYSELESGGQVSVRQLYVSRWTPPVLSLVIFALLGATEDARALYLHVLRTAGRYVGCGLIGSRKRHGVRSALDTIQFSPPPGSTTDTEAGTSGASDKEWKADDTVMFPQRSLGGDTGSSTIRTNSSA